MPQPCACWLTDGGRSPRADRPTGIVCANDRVALGAMLACGQLGLRVPADLSIVGYDDDEPLARTVVPGLTTSHCPTVKWARRAIELLLAELDHGAAQAPEHWRTPYLSPCPVVMRGSVAAPHANLAQSRLRGPAHAP